MCGAGGMYRERIRANKRWKGKPRHDTVFVKVTDEQDDDEEGSKLEIIHGMLIARVLLFFSFRDPVLCEEVPCALVNWFMPVSNQRDGVMGMWELKLEMVGMRPTLEVIHLDSIVRGSCPDSGPARQKSSFFTLRKERERREKERIYYSILPSKSRFSPCKTPAGLQLSVGIPLARPFST